MCTLILARRLIPGLSDYTLGTLSCACQLSRRLSHRASGDTENVGELLIYMLIGTGWTIEQMLEFYKRPYVHKYMMFGKHQGVLMHDVPLSYLAWLSKQDLDRDMRATVNYWMKRK